MPSYAQKSEALKLLDQGKSEYSKGNILGASAIWEYAYQLDSSNSKIKTVFVNSLIILAKDQCRNGEFEESLSTIDKAAKNSPGNADIERLQERIKEILAASLESESEEVPEEYLKYLTTKYQKEQISSLLFPKPKPKPKPKPEPKPKPKPEPAPVKKEPPKEEKPAIIEKPVTPPATKEVLIEKTITEKAKEPEEPAKPSSKQANMLPFIIIGAGAVLIIILVIILKLRKKKPSVQASRPHATAQPVMTQETPKHVRRPEDINIQDTDGKSRIETVPIAESVDIQGAQPASDTPGQAHHVVSPLLKVKKQKQAEPTAAEPPSEPLIKDSPPLQEEEKIKIDSIEPVIEKTPEPIAVKEPVKQDEQPEPAVRLAEPPTQSVSIPPPVEPPRAIKESIAETPVPEAAPPEPKKQEAPTGTDDIVGTINTQIQSELIANGIKEVDLANRLLGTDVDLGVIQLFHVTKYAESDIKKKAVSLMVEFLCSNNHTPPFRLLNNLMTNIETEYQQLLINSIIARTKSNPDNSKIHYVLGLIYLSLNFYNEASASLLQSVKLDKNNLNAYIAIGIICVKKRAYEKAFICWQKIEDKIDSKKYPNIASALYYSKKGQIEEASQHARKEVDQNMEQSQRLIALAKLAYKQNLYLDTISNLRNAIELDPTNPNTFYMLGTAHLSKKIASEAKVCFRHSFLLDPQFNNIYNALGVIYMVRGKSDTARKIFESVVQFTGDSDIAKKAKHNLSKLASWPAVQLDNFKY